MKKIVLTGLLSFGLSLWATEKKIHREHATHEHGAGHLGIAFEGKIGKIEFKIPSESIFGFEHEAKNKKDKALKIQGLATLENKIADMVVFEPQLKCLISKEKIEVKQNGKHSETLANYNVVCAQSPLETAIEFNFQKYFQGIKDIDVQVIVDNLQKSTELKGKSVLFLK